MEVTDEFLVAENECDGEACATPSHLQRQLQHEDPRCVFVVRRVAALGLDWVQRLTAHYGQFGTVSRVKLLQRGSLQRIRLAFVVMAASEDVAAVLAQGSQQSVCGSQICVMPFKGATEWRDRSPTSTRRLRGGDVGWVHIDVQPNALSAGSSSAVNAPPSVSVWARRRYPHRHRCEEVTTKGIHMLDAHAALLQEADTRCILVALNVAPLGFQAPERLMAHFSQYGHVLRAFSALSQLEVLHGQFLQVRPGDATFLVMQTADAVASSLKAGSVHHIDNVQISLQSFHPVDRRNKFGHGPVVKKGD